MFFAISYSHGTANHYKMSQYYAGPEVVRSKAQENTVVKIREHVENWEGDIQCILQHNVYTICYFTHNFSDGSKLLPRNLAIVI